MKLLITLPLVAVLLTACGQTQEFPPIDAPHAAVPAAPASDPAPIGPGRTDLAACGGTAVADRIGLNVATLPAKGKWTALRILRPGMMMTMDYSATRLNVNVDGAEVIVDMSCG